MNATTVRGEPASQRIGIAAATGFLVVAPVSSSPGLRVALLAIAAVALAWLAWRHGRGQLAPAPPAIVWVPLALWGALAAASVAWSVDPAYSRSELRPEIGYAALAFAVFHFAAGTVRLWATALLAGTTALALADVARGILAPAMPSFCSGGGRFSTHLVMAAPFLCLLLAPAPAGLGRRPALAAAGAVAFAAAAVQSENRIVWIAFLASLLVLVAALVPRVPAANRRKAVVGAALAAIAITALFAASMVQKLDVYPAARDASETLSMDLRPRLWAIAREVVADRPLAGYGFGKEIAAPRFRAGIGTGAGSEFATHGHNLFLNATISLGIPGLLAICAVMAALAAAHARNLARPATRLAGAIGLALVAGFLVKNLTDDFFNRHNALVFWALNGMLVGLGGREPGRP